MQETWIWSLGLGDPLEKGVATRSSILAWRIPRTEEPGGLQSMGSLRVRHDWDTTLKWRALPLPKLACLASQGGDINGAQVLCKVSVVPGITHGHTESSIFGSKEKWGSERKGEHTIIITVRAEAEAPRPWLPVRGPFQGTTPPASEHPALRPARAPPRTPRGEHAQIVRVNFKSWWDFMPTEGRICTLLVNELWRTKGHCQFGDKTFAETASCNYYPEVNLHRLIRKQRSRCWVNSEIPEASRIPTPLLKCFHADHHHIIVFFGSPLQSLTTKPKATGRQGSTTNGLSLPIPRGHVVVLISQGYLQKELSGRHWL